MPSVRRCMIVDDEPAAHYVLQNYIGQNQQLKLEYQCYNGFDAANYLSENAVDILFLDIDMPEMTGLELLSQLKHPPRTILTTAYSEFALESYDFGVVDYLLKPIFYPRFEKAISRLQELFPQPVSDHRQSVLVKVDSDLVEIPLDDILYAQSYGNYVRIFTPAKAWLASMTTNELERSLPQDRFMRIHKSFVVSLEKVSVADREWVELGSERIPVGITYRRELSDRLR